MRSQSNPDCVTEKPRAETHFFIGELWGTAALPPGEAEQRGESAKAEVIVVLLGQLLHGQGV